MFIDSRRRMLISAGVSTLASSFHWPSFGSESPGGIPPKKIQWPELLGAWKVGGTNYAGTWSSQSGARGVALPGRAHEVIQDYWRNGEAVAIARRPGQFLARIDTENCKLVKLVESEQMRTFNGHAVFSSDGRILYTSENDLVSGDGIIGVRDGNNLEKIGELPSHGIAPHGFLLGVDGSLLIANGGVGYIPDPGQTHAGLLADIDPSITNINTESGELLGQWRLPDRFLSIRHLARGRDGSVGAALQAAHVSNDDRETSPVFACLRDGHFSTINSPLQDYLQGYAGEIISIDLINETEYALGCSHAGKIARWSTRGEWKDVKNQRNACAIVECGNSIIAASEEGQIDKFTSSEGDLRSSIAAGVSWENHIKLIVRT